LEIERTAIVPFGNTGAAPGLPTLASMRNA
jgi:hypothetical protein